MQTTETTANGISAGVGLDQRLERLRAARGDRIGIDEIGEVVESLLGAKDANLAEDQEMVLSELREMLEIISRAKTELVTMRPRQLSELKIPAATIELDAVVRATAQAADQIMDAAEKVEGFAADMTGADAEKMAEISTQLFEASSFQDITGQRINKVVNTLNHLEERLSHLAEAIGDNDISEDDITLTVNEQGLLEDDKDILHGPQLEEHANTQEDIDAILASFD